MEAYDDGDADDGHVERETQVGEEGALVGAVVAGVAVGVGEEEGAEEGGGARRIWGWECLFVEVLDFFSVVFFWFE